MSNLHPNHHFRTWLFIICLNCFKPLILYFKCRIFCQIQILKP